MVRGETSGKAPLGLDRGPGLRGGRPTVMPGTHERRARGGTESSSFGGGSMDSRGLERVSQCRGAIGAPTQTRRSAYLNASAARQV